MAAQLSSDEEKIIGLAGPLWIRILKSKEKTVLDRIYGNFRNNEIDHLTDLAEYAIIREMITEITNHLRKNDSAPAGD